MGMPRKRACVGWKHPQGNYTIIDYMVDGRGISRIKIHCHVGRLGCLSDQGGWKRKTDFSNAGPNSSGAESCGCLKKQILSEKQLVHGDSLNGSPHFRLHSAWKNMKTRCKPKFSQADNYFNKGIRVCPEWEDNYQAFKDWSLKNGWEEGLTLERKNNSEGYNPNNCKWITKQEQARNTSRIRKYTYQGETMNLSQWAKDQRSAVEYGTLLARLRNGWNFEEALTQPSRQNGVKVEIRRRLMKIFYSVRARCNNSDAPAFPNYGGRGIQVCKEWLDNPDAFINWAIPLYEDGFDLDRIDNNAGYSPGNCRFVTRLENVRNRRTTIKLTLGCQTMTPDEWVKQPNVGPNVDANIIRLRRRKDWSDHDAITIQKGQRRTPD
jgi:hypothetical protein